MKGKRNTTSRDEHKTPSDVLLAAKLKTGGGTHGGGSRQRNRSDRRSTKQQLRQGNYDD